MNMFGLDPFITLGSLTALSGAAGWLLGPFVGNAVFGIVHRNVKGMIAQVCLFFLFLASLSRDFKGGGLGVCD